MRGEIMYTVPSLCRDPQWHVSNRRFGGGANAEACELFRDLFRLTSYVPATESARNTFPASTRNREYPAFAYSIPPTGYSLEFTGGVPARSTPLTFGPFHRGLGFNVQARRRSRGSDVLRKLPHGRTAD